MTWRCTVCSLTTRREAICLFVRPSARSWRTSRSRRVTVGADGLVTDARTLRERAASPGAPRAVKAPALVDILFPLGRIALIGGIIVLVIQKTLDADSDITWAMVLIGAGALVFVIERIALASVWAFGKGGRPRGQ